MPLSTNDKSIDAARQMTVFIPHHTKKHSPLILISEPTSLLRPLDDSTGQLIAKSSLPLRGAQLFDQSSWYVPDARNAPEFYLLGESDIKQETIGNITLHYFSDNPLLTERYRLIQKHKKALSYLVQQIFSQNDLDLAQKKYHC